LARIKERLLEGRKQGAALSLNPDSFIAAVPHVAEV